MKIRKTCENCGSTFLTKNENKIYCSSKCKSLKKRIRPTREYKKKKLINFCQLCGFKEIPEILIIHHIDRNRQNNSSENLLRLCPFCHAMIHRGFFIIEDDSVRFRYKLETKWVKSILKSQPQT